MHKKDTETRLNSCSCEPLGLRRLLPLHRCLQSGTAVFESMSVAHNLKSSSPLYDKAGTLAANESVLR